MMAFISLSVLNPSHLSTTNIGDRPFSLLQCLSCPIRTGHRLHLGDLRPFLYLLPLWGSLMAYPDLPAGNSLLVVRGEQQRPFSPPPRQNCGAHHVTYMDALFHSVGIHRHCNTQQSRGHDEAMVAMVPPPTGRARECC